MNIEPSRRRHMSVLAAVGPNGGTFDEVLARTNVRMSEREFVDTFTFLKQQGVLTRGADGQITRDMQRWLRMRRDT
jgi:hypothetical protein